MFDRERGLYKEGDVPSPVNFYGISELRGWLWTPRLGDSPWCGLVGFLALACEGRGILGFRALESLVREKVVRTFVDRYLSPTYIPLLDERVRIFGGDVCWRLCSHCRGKRLSGYEFVLLLAETWSR